VRVIVAVTQFLTGQRPLLVRSPESSPFIGIYDTPDERLSPRFHAELLPHRTQIDLRSDYTPVACTTLKLLPDAWGGARGHEVPAKYFACASRLSLWMNIFTFLPGPRSRYPNITQAVWFTSRMVAAESADEERIGQAGRDPLKHAHGPTSTRRFGGRPEFAGVSVSHPSHRW